MKIGHTPTHTNISERQLNITLLDAFDYSECPDTNISRKIFFMKTASSVRRQNDSKLGHFLATKLNIVTCHIRVILE